MSPKLPSKFLIFSSLMVIGTFSVHAATLMNMTFDAGGGDINETTGWNGTTAPGGSLASGLTVSTGMSIYGDFTAQNDNDVFHVDGWKTNNAVGTRVGFEVQAQTGYNFSLGGGTETFSTRVHQHPTTGSSTDMFNSVTLTINGITIGSQSYTPAGGPQTLVWNIGTNGALDNLTSAIFDLTFSGVNNPTASNHGPEWSKADGAFVSFTGTVAAIPEPSQSLLALCGLGLTFLRRRRA